MMKKLIILVLFFGFAFSQSAQIIDNANTVQNVSSSAAFKVYADTFGINPDFALRLCGVGQRYVSAVYSANLGGGNYRYVTISKNLTTGSSDTLVYTSNNLGGGCYGTPVDAFAFSQFRDFTRTPPVYVSAFPGRAHAMYSNSVTGSSPGFIGMNYSDGWLKGSYSVPIPPLFNQGTGMVTANVNSITFETDVGSVTKISSDPEWGLNSSTGRSMLLALCSDDFGDVCSDAVIANASGDLPVSLALGSPTNDQVIYNRYIVVDGLGYGPFCIGADLTLVSVGFSANPVNPGVPSTTTITIRNDGNVNVTTDFRLTLNITGPGAYFQQYNWTITEDLAPAGTTTRNLVFNDTNTSGNYVFTAEADSLDEIVECNENNINSNTLTVIKTYTIHVLIDGVENDTFAYSGRPYNVTVYLNDSDGNIVTNSKFVFTETNGLNPFTPTQIWNDGIANYGVKSYSIGEMSSNASGYAMLAVVPTCNRLYNDPIKGPLLVANIGNYFMEVKAYEGAIFRANKTLYVTDDTCADPGWVNNKELINKDYVQPVYDWLYTMYSILKKLLVP
jgi:hypothetical protein